MTASERPDPKAGPLCNLSQAYFGSLDRMAKAYEPAVRGLGRWNLEVLNLMTRRTQAWVELPVQLGRGRTPQDLVNLQLKFWQQAASQYTEGFQRLAAALGSCAVGPALGRTTLANGDARKHDHITFPEPKESASPELPKRSDRRAA